MGSVTINYIESPLEELIVTRSRCTIGLLPWLLLNNDCWECVRRLDDPNIDWPMMKNFISVEGKNMYKFVWCRKPMQLSVQNIGIKRREDNRVRMKTLLPGLVAPLQILRVFIEQHSPNRRPRKSIWSVNAGMGRMSFENKSHDLRESDLSHCACDFLQYPCENDWSRSQSGTNWLYLIFSILYWKRFQKFFFVVYHSRLSEI